LVVHGTKDTFVPVESSRAALPLLRSEHRLVEIEGSQHGFAVHDDPQYLNPQSQQWQAFVIRTVADWITKGLKRTGRDQPRGQRIHRGCAARCLRLLKVRSSGFGHLPPAADAGSAVVAGNQSQSLKRFEFPQDGPLAWAVPGTDCQVYPPGVPVPAALGDDGQKLDLPVREGSVTHEAGPG
jgi:hypothetical protein